MHLEVYTYVFSKISWNRLTKNGPRSTFNICLKINSIVYRLDSPCTYVFNQLCSCRYRQYNESIKRDYGKETYG